MGFQTTIILHNDFINDILKDKRLGEKLADCIARAQWDGPTGTTGIIVYNSHHMDDTRLRLIGHGGMFHVDDENMSEDVIQAFISHMKYAADKLGFKLIKKTKPKNLDTWKKTFYPIAAAHVDKEKAVEHSLKKWIGLRPANLKRHNLKINENGIVGNTVVEKLSISSTSCALCQHYYVARHVTAEDRCAKCPLAIVRGGTPCDRERKGEGVSPFGVFTQTNNPEPMIKWLKAIPV